jgi:hypothetical protein
VRLLKSLNGSANQSVLKIAAWLSCAMVLIASCFIRPDLSRGHDELLYLTAAENFAARGLDYSYTREPFYPLFLAALKTAGIDPVAWIALIQNAAFLGALYFFLCSLLGQTQSRAASLLLAAATTLIPTFLVPMNGSLYTESLSATFIFLMLGACNRISANPPRPATAGYLTLALLSSMALGLIKGTFSFIHIAFALLAGAWLLIAKRRARKTPADTRAPVGKLVFVLILIAAGSQLGSGLWLRLQQSRSAEPLAVYSRGGVVLYGRTEYAKNFDFATQSVPFLVCAVSISAYRKLYADNGYQYTFDAENTLGYDKLAKSDDATLFKLGLENIASQPLRQCFFSLFELARFPIHHTNAGFASLHIPEFSAFYHSSVVAMLLKLFNALLLLSIPFYLWRKGLTKIATKSVSPDDPVVSGTALYLIYVIAYLSVYSFASTIARMVYPIAPLLIVLNWQMLKSLWKKTDAALLPDAKL